MANVGEGWESNWAVKIQHLISNAWAQISTYLPLRYFRIRLTDQHADRKNAFLKRMRGPCTLWTYGMKIHWLLDILFHPLRRYYGIIWLRKFPEMAAARSSPTQLQGSQSSAGVFTLTYIHLSLLFCATMLASDRNTLASGVRYGRAQRYLGNTGTLTRLLKRT